MIACDSVPKPSRGSQSPSKKDGQWVSWDLTVAMARLRKTSTGGDSGTAYKGVMSVQALSPNLPGDILGIDEISTVTRTLLLKMNT